MKQSLTRLFSRSQAFADAPYSEPAGLADARAARRAKSTLIVIAGALAIVAAVAGSYYFAMRPVTLRIAVGPSNSDDFRIVQAIAQTFARDQASVRLKLIATDGAMASATLLGEQGTDLAVVRGDNELPKNAQTVATLRKNWVVLWVPAQPRGRKPKVTKVEQLGGQRIGVIGRSPANSTLLKAILEQYNVPADRVEFVQLPTAGIGEALRTQKIDVVMAVGPLNSKITAEAIAATSRDGASPTFIPIDAADAIAQRRPVFEASEIPAGAFGGAPARPDDAVKTISFGHHIVARKSLSEATVATLTRQLFTIRQTILGEFPRSAQLEAPDTDKDAAIPVHPGAAAYVDGEEKTFLDRYSDYIWWGLMGASAFGSLGAWFASYLRRPEQQSNSTQRERLLDMITAARRADLADQLDEMQMEADAILRDTLNCYENGAIDSGALTAFSIALEQFHNAVADRKAVLAMIPAPPLPQRPPASAGAGETPGIHVVKS